MKVDNLSIKHVKHYGDKYYCVNKKKGIVKIFNDSFELLVFLEDYYYNDDYEDKLKLNGELKEKLDAWLKTNSRLNDIKNTTE